ncbi:MULTISPECIES: TIGR01777 family oxidoreductase [Paraliobacillus]|uniref:TIGR01777 family oxidoreductase n=1 Tax=Paraliobacillus TaxID=200903 RepID=UPI000DD4C3BE|nr:MULTISPECIES: TIGR01777 family oxidoreductase [Paraliobacillus]
MKIAIAGGTGFVGKHVTDLLVSKGHQVYILTRSPEKYLGTENIRYVGWLSERYTPEQSLTDCNAIINLAGESLFGYWTSDKKERIVSSRVKATDSVIKLIDGMEKKPEVLINASAVGFYGTSTTEMFSEETTKSGDDFLAEVTQKWESVAYQATERDVRVVCARLGIVLGKKGTLELMALPYKFFVGGKIGSGEQWISWIHVKDVAALFLHAIEDNSINGPLNASAPHPIQQKVFSKQLANKLHRPDWIPIPAFFLRTLLGEMSMLVVDGQAVFPKKAQAHHYSFEYPEIEQALDEIYHQIN